jgi:hypothetical protein
MISDLSFASHNHVKSDIEENFEEANQQEDVKMIAVMMMGGYTPKTRLISHILFCL